MQITGNSQSVYEFMALIQHEHDDRFMVIARSSNSSCSKKEKKKR